MKRLALALALSAIATGANAGNSLIVQNQAVAVAKSALTVRPAHEWNKMGARPGRNSETWTLDGDTLNDLTFYGGIEEGKTLFREVDRREKPLPRFSSTMLLTEVPGLLENSYRIALGTPLMTIGKVEPAKLAGRKAVRFEYSFVRQGEDVRRRGEAYALIVQGKLFMITFEAPVLYYFDAGIEQARQVIDSATLPS
jgi:hypothetical protein